ncbi:PREDICTED: cAMP-responsive element-binding protein-like 2 isoform X1 [Dufourea novaeangliae]|nr:PREDICTED: cAMP-responsive element-binding protein-like 2 isoform X1 [Dufourea novaeangliae]
MEVEPLYIAENETEGSRGDRKEGGKRGRKPGRKASDKSDMKAKLERCRQSAREVRGRKKLRYQYLEELVADRESSGKNLERSRQSARECRARKKLRYQYLEELVADREKAVIALRKELEMYRLWGQELDAGRVPEGLPAMLEEIGSLKRENAVN